MVWYGMVWYGNRIISIAKVSQKDRYKGFSKNTGTKVSQKTPVQRFLKKHRYKGFSKRPVQRFLKNHTKKPCKGSQYKIYL
jgi:hypothetical protein